MLQKTISNGRKFKNRVGEKYTTRQGYKIEIVEYYSYANCNIKFLHNDFILEGLSYQQIQQGKVRNPYHASVVNIGYIGVGKYKSYENNVLTLYYQKWHSMLIRSYDKKYHLKFPTYKDVTVCEEWHNFQVFAEWFDNNYRENQVLDKDILIEGNKVYSPDTCCFVPFEINTFFIKKGNMSGVIFNPQGCKYRAYISKFNQQIWLGSFNTEKEAEEIHKKEKQIYAKELAHIHKEYLNKRIFYKLINY